MEMTSVSISGKSMSLELLDNTSVNIQSYRPDQPRGAQGHGPGVEHRGMVCLERAMFASIGLQEVSSDWCALLKISPSQKVPFNVGLL